MNDDASSLARETENTFPLARSAYLHVPFCLQRCGYCDFSIIAGRDDLIPRYLDALSQEIQKELESSDPPLELDTLFIGGGTPTLLSPSELKKLFEITKRYFRLAPDAEFSIEANPDGLTPEKQEVLQSAGVNRISLGVQSFDSAVLKQLDRKHSPEHVHQLYQQLLTRFANLSVDLIYGVPNQTFQSWDETLNQAISLKPSHISTYALTFEKGTKFWSQRQKRELIAPPDSLEVAMYQLTVKRLQEHGFHQYEVSNFSQSGRESVHNTAYWTGKSYHAFGPGASRFVNGIRSTNHRSPFTWLKKIEAGFSAIDTSDDLLPSERARELLAIGLRYLSGVEKNAIAKQTGKQIELIARSELDQLIQRGWIEETPTHLRLTEQGILFADAVACEVI